MLSLLLRLHSPSRQETCTVITLFFPPYIRKISDHRQPYPHLTHIPCSSRSYSCWSPTSKAYLEKTSTSNQTQSDQIRMEMQADQSGKSKNVDLINPKSPFCSEHTACFCAKPSSGLKLGSEPSLLSGRTPLSTLTLEKRCPSAGHLHPHDDESH